MNTGNHVVLALLLIVLGAGTVAAAEDQLSAANALYSQSVDLANAGKYTEALNAADQALAYNVTSINHIIQANRAGILVMLGRYDDAITAADAALAVEGNLTTTHAAAYYNKGDALRYLGRTDEARAAFEQAYSLDNNYTIPADLTLSPTKSPVSVASVLAAASMAVIIAGGGKKR